MHIEVSIQDGYPDGYPGGFPIDEATWQAWFEHWITRLAPTQDSEPLHPTHEYELSLRLTDDHEIQTLNRSYRAKDQPTDVLAFSALEVDCPSLPDDEPIEPLYLGDIVISVDTALIQAQQQSHSLAIELGWLASHGLLHLLGWDHPDDEHLERMLDQQRQLLESVNLISTEMTQV